VAENELPIDFADPWEHVRLLSDRARNDALLQMLRRRAPGARVMEVGCGTGLLSCMAAKLGAAHVYAVEPTPLVERARDFVAANHLESQVTVLQGLVEDLEPRPVDVVFSELLNADPFAEGVVPAMNAAAKWLVPGGFLSPRRLKVYVALAWASESPDEHVQATAEIERLCKEVGLDPGALLHAIRCPHPHRFFTHGERPLSQASVAFDLAIGDGNHGPVESEVVLRSTVDGEVGGALVWFSGEVDEDVWMTNPPGGGSHWGQMICGWARPLSVRAGGSVRLKVTRVGSNVVVAPIE
jgi:SAM-dependent methyltransferase